MFPPFPTDQLLGQLRGGGFCAVSAPFFPRSGPPSGSFNGLHSKSNFRAMTTGRRRAATARMWGTQALMRQEEKTLSPLEAASTPRGGTFANFALVGGAGLTLDGPMNERQRPAPCRRPLCGWHDLKPWSGTSPFISIVSLGSLGLSRMRLTRLLTWALCPMDRRLPSHSLPSAVWRLARAAQSTLLRSPFQDPHPC